MGDKTRIAWCDHTFNPWIGCTKVSEGCRNCYAERDNLRYGWNPNGWGAGKDRQRTSPKNWTRPLLWAKKAARDGVTQRVFCASLADIFDDEVQPAWRADLWSLIGACGEIAPTLEWLLLTKRPENITRMLPAEWMTTPPRFLRIGITAEDQNHFETRMPALFDAWKGKNFVSYEPAIDALDIKDGIKAGLRVDWVICGGESGANARPMHPNWARSIRDQCVSAEIPFFLKQWGAWLPVRQTTETWFRYPVVPRLWIFPDGFMLVRTIKGLHERLIDGKPWNEFPKGDL